MKTYILVQHHESGGKGTVVYDLDTSFIKNPGFWEGVTWFETKTVEEYVKELERNNART